MFIDIAFPFRNEKKFVERAKAMNCSGIIFVYEKDIKKNLETVKSLNSKDFKVYSAIIGKVSKKYDFVFSKGSRKDFENKKTSVVFALETGSGKDKHHYRSSGLNQVLCGLAKEKNILIAFSFNSVLKAKDKGLVIGRMMQNVKMCKKYCVKMAIASFAQKPEELRHWKDLVSFGIVIGMNAKEAKETVLNRKV